MALFIFSYENPIRSILRDFISNSYFAGLQKIIIGFIYHMIALNSLLLALDEP